MPQATMRAAAEALKFQLAYNIAITDIVAELVKALGGEIPEDTHAAIRQHLGILCEAAIEAPEAHAALRAFDELVALLPPPGPSAKL